MGNLIVPPFPLVEQGFPQGLENSLGCFVVLEKDFHLIFDKQMARVLIELCVSKGLLAEIDIYYGEKVICQKLDYINIPFICGYCHEI